MNRALRYHYLRLPGYSPLAWLVFLQQEDGEVKLGQMLRNLHDQLCWSINTVIIKPSLL